MYTKKAWGGNVDPAITIKFTPHEEDHSISLIIFEWNDEEYLGRYPSEDSYAVCFFPRGPPVVDARGLMVTGNSRKNTSVPMRLSARSSATRPMSANLY